VIKEGIEDVSQPLSGLHWYAMTSSFHISLDAPTTSCLQATRNRKLLEKGRFSVDFGAL
jgi:hypothetical protein